jgi:lipopolysaccharide transport system permease protein
MPQTSLNAILPVLTLEAGRGERHYWRDLWRYRELLGFLAWRDIKVRYKQTALGVVWAIVQPAVAVAIFTFVFGRLANMPSGGVPYVVMVMAGQLGWQLFAASLSGTSGSLVGSSHLISKVYFPRLIVPLSTIAVALIDFLVVLGLYAIVAVVFRVAPTWRILALPLFAGGAVAIALGVGLWLAALTVRFRDFRHILPFLLQVGIFVTPVGYRTDFLPNWRDLLAFNPMTAVVEGFRWCLLPDAAALYWPGLLTSAAVAALFTASGVWYFRRTERTFADII